jgi:adenylate cyclase
VERLLDLNSNVELVPEERELSILFADLSGFTSMSENMSPTEVASFLNGVFERLTLAIFEQDGTVDKFIGDAIMAIFGAPVFQDDHALRAVRAAVRMQHELDKYNLEVFGSHKIRMRIGVNSGPAVAGEIGSSKRRDYTVIGDTVNVASRLESSVAQPHQVVIGQQTYEAVKGQVTCVALEPCAVKGKADPIHSYLVVEADSPIDAPAT